MSLMKIKWHKDKFIKETIARFEGQKTEKRRKQVKNRLKKEKILMINHKGLIKDATKIMHKEIISIHVNHHTLQSQKHKTEITNNKQ